MPPRPKATPRKPPAAKQVSSSPEPSVEIPALVKAAGLLVLTGAYSAISQLSLSPVYGSIPAAFYHQPATTVAALLATTAGPALIRYLPRNYRSLIAVLTFWIPTIQHVLFKYSGSLGPKVGPLVTESLTFLPLVVLSMLSANQAQQPLIPPPRSISKEMMPAAGSYLTISLVSKFVSAVLPSKMGTHAFLSRSGLQLLAATAYAAIQPSVWLLAALPAVLHTLGANPHVNTAHGLAIANSTLQANQFSILARQESVTGYLSVLESKENEFRVLRCDHSLLGGHWLVTPRRQMQGQQQEETIYAIFTMLEAVRLVETRDTRPDAEKKALVIGLGIGTAPSALIRHGINTTVVEIDPVVHEYATRYFGLPSNHTAALTDAVGWVSEATRSGAAGTYDYIIHDVFTGGAEPAALFTYEFLEGLRDLLAEDGVIAINYAGDVALPSTRLVLNTIHAVFPACRIFRDAPARPASSSSSSSSDFINMALFCVRRADPPPPHSDTPAIRFRPAVEADFLGSLSRRHLLRPDPDLEVAYTPGDNGTVLRAGRTQALERYQAEGVLAHWRIMRENVLPDVVWETW